MIPKIIHYCWFGGNPLPEEYQKYLASWKKFCPDYEIKEWNEGNFDLNSVPYVKEAYQSKKWAFITDYVRLYVLDTFGGIYMDTDVEVLRNLDVFLGEEGFSGFERKNAVPTGIMAAEKGQKFIHELLTQYDNLHFIKKNGDLDETTNVTRITETALKYGLNLNNTTQTIEGFTFYPTDYFCPKNSRTLEINITENSYTIHHFAGSWDSDNKLRRNVKRILPTWMLKVIVKVMDILGVK